MAQIEAVRKRIIVVLVALLVLDVAAVALLLSPVGRSREARVQEYDHVRQQLKQKQRDALPARDMDQKLGTARTEISGFYDNRFPHAYSDVTETLGKLAKDTHVSIGQVRYDSKAVDLPNLQRLEITAAVTGDYANLMRFINGLEREKTLFVLTSIDLAEVQSGGIRLNMKLETYMRTGQTA